MYLCLKRVAAVISFSAIVYNLMISSPILFYIQSWLEIQGFIIMYLSAYMIKVSGGFINDQLLNYFSGCMGGSWSGWAIIWGDFSLCMILLSLLVSTINIVMVGVMRCFIWHYFLNLGFYLGIACLGWSCGNTEQGSFCWYDFLFAIN